MDWNDLRYVLAIVREGTLVGAAAALGVAHSTVGRRLSGLEERLGVRLFDRTPDGFVPTPLNTRLSSDPATVQALAARTLVGRNGRPGDFAGPVVWLASAASAYVTGQSIAVDGGFSVH